MVAERSKASTLDRGGEGSNPGLSLSFIWSSLSPLSSLLSLLSIWRVHNAQCMMHDDDAREEEELKEKNQDLELRCCHLCL